MVEPEESKMFKETFDGIERQGTIENAPKDKFNIVYVILVFIGIGVLLPWNFFITASLYFQYKMRNQSIPSSVDSLLPEYRTETQKFFSNYVTLCSMLPFALTNIINLLLQNFIPAYVRLIFSSVIVMLLFVLTTALAKIPLSASVFSAATLVSVVAINISSSINQGSVFGLVSVLPPANSRGYLEGQALAGITAALANIVAIGASSSYENTGFAYFLIAAVIILASIGLYFLLFKNRYFKYYWDRENKIKNELRVVKQSTSLGLKLAVIGLFQAMWEVRWTGFAALTTFGVSLTIFPSMLVLFVPNNFDKYGMWHNKYYHAVLIFLNFNICDYLGRMLVAWVQWPTFRQKYLLLILAVLRVILVPIAFFCNLQPRRAPAVFYHDAFPIIITMIVGLTNGYLTSLAVRYAPKYASPGNQERAGIATGTYIALGLASGVAVSYGVVTLL